jgi:hypothetical protein
LTIRKGDGDRAISGTREAPFSKDRVPTFIGSTLIAIAVSAFPRGLVDATAGVALAALCRIAAVRLFGADQAVTDDPAGSGNRAGVVAPHPSRRASVNHRRPRPTLA